MFLAENTTDNLTEGHNEIPANLLNGVARVWWTVNFSVKIWFEQLLTILSL